MNAFKRMTHSLYRITCGHTMTTQSFESTLYDLLDEYYKDHQVCVTVDFLSFGKSMYSGKYPSRGECVAMIFMSVNPSRNPEGITPYIQWFADRLAKLHDQAVVLCSAISLAETTIIGKRPEPSKNESNASDIVIPLITECSLPKI